MARYEYEGTFRYKRYKKPLGNKKYIILAAVLLAVVCGAVFLQKNTYDLVAALCVSSAQSNAATAANEGVAKAMEWNAADYDDFIVIERDAQNNVLSMRSNAQKINLLARQAVSLCTANLNARCEQGVKVPLGAFSGAQLLAGFGPKITFKTLPVGAVNCQFSSAFQSAGINQTAHSVFMRVTATVNIVFPSGTKRVEATSEILVCETVIVGKVPQTYLNGNLFE